MGHLIPVSYIIEGYEISIGGVKLLNFSSFYTQKVIGIVTVNGFVENKPDAYTVNMGITVSITCPDVYLYLTNCSTSVSYTHLDVYKRQLEGWSVPNSSKIQISSCF